MSVGSRPPGARRSPPSATRSTKPPASRPAATGGLALASKTLIERLDEHDAAALGIDPDRAHYDILGELVTASEKARRDAPAIAVCDSEHVWVSKTVGPDARL